MTVELIPANEQVVEQLEVLRSGFIKEMNQEFIRQRNGQYDAVQRFWFKNTDADGNPVAQRVEGGTNLPTGPEVLSAMGTAAQAFMATAGLRAQFLIDVATSLGQAELVDASKFGIPFVLTWEDDGRLASAVPV